MTPIIYAQHERRYRGMSIEEMREAVALWDATEPGRTTDDRGRREAFANTLRKEVNSIGRIVGTLKQAPYWERHNAGTLFDLTDSEIAYIRGGGDRNTSVPPAEPLDDPAPESLTAALLAVAAVLERLVTALCALEGKAS